MEVRAKCVRDPAGPDDGERVLVCRMWPRSVALGSVSRWEKRLAPSAKLDFALYRGWITAREFAQLFAAEVREQEPLLRDLAIRANLRPLTFVCTCADRERCHRDVLARMVAGLRARRAPPRAPAARREPVHAMA